jgi:hypothetical protein
MNENLKDRDVILVKEKDSDKLNVLSEINTEGELETVSPNLKNQHSFMKFDRHGNALDNFLENFGRQFRDPTEFMLFKVPADRVEEAANNLQEALKNPDSPVNRAFLDVHRVEPPTPKEYAIQPGLVDWQKLEHYGITREGLEKTGNMDRLLDYRKTGLVPVAIKFDGETLRSDARFSLRKQEDGTFSPAIHLIRHKPELERPYFGVRFTKEDRDMLEKADNLGRVAEAEFKPGEKTPVLISLDKLTNEISSFRQEWIRVPDTYKGIELSEEQKHKLGNGEKVELKDMTSKEGRKFDAGVQFNADKRLFELVFADRKKQSQNQKETQQGETKSPYIPKKIGGVNLTDQQRGDLKAGQTVYLAGMTDREGQKYDAYVKVNTEKNKLDFFKNNPDEAKKQGAEATPDNTHNTQVAQNNEGKTAEATKNVKEPLGKGQTQPTEKQAAKQEQDKLKKGRGVKM